MCGELGGLRTQNEKLREQVGDAKNWKTVKEIKWLPDYFVLTQGLYTAVADKLKKICNEIGVIRKEIPSSEWGTVKLYPVKAIEILHNRVHRDDNLLKKYRKAA